MERTTDSTQGLLVFSRRGVLSLPPLPFVVREPVVGRYRLTTRAPDERLVLAA